MGMSSDEYWNDDPWLAKDYREAYKLQTEETNARAWLQGLYNFKAFETVLQNAFGKGKKEKYPEKPIDLYPKEKTPEEIRDEYYQRLKAWGDRWNEQYRN